MRSGSRHPITRRLLLSAATATPLIYGAPSVLAARSKKLKRVETTAHGTTFHFHLDKAPYGPDFGTWNDPTVLVFVPNYYRLPKGRYVDTVMHFHGHQSTAYIGLSAGRLREQLHDSKQNAVLVVPQGPLRAVSSEGGRLDRRNGMKKLLVEVMREMRRAEVEKALGKASLAGNKGVGHICLSAHSGGYKVAAHCLARGGFNVGEVWLFDALYGEVDTFRRWVVDRRGRTGRARHKLMSYYAGGPAKPTNEALLARLKRAGVRCYHENGRELLTRGQLAKGQAVFILTPQAHGAVTFTHNNFRDCLYASGLKRFIKSDWFENRNDPRRIDRRG
ncbi:MAG: hypothetical protein AAGA56_22320 [Myxococcota bacterium]